MEQGSERTERDLSRVPPALRPHVFPEGASFNPGGVDKASGLPAKTLRARLKDMLEADEARLKRILELRVSLAEKLDPDNPNVTLKAIDDLIEHIDGKLKETRAHEGEIHIKRLQLDTPPGESP